MKMKQILSVLAAGLTSAALLTGCAAFLNSDTINSMDLVDESGTKLLWKSAHHI